METYIIATVKSWNINNFHIIQQENNLVKFILIDNVESLNIENLRLLKPRYIFFPHWSWIVPSEILEEFDCVCFHMTDVPYGRGGSPLQNLIIRGHQETKISALRMETELDAGPVYYKDDLSLDGNAQEIFERASLKVFELIKKIINNKPTPVAQDGEIVTFKRRNSQESIINDGMALEDLYNHIRMLDADSYPRAFYIVGDNKFEFSDVKINSAGELMAQVVIKDICIPNE